MFTRVQRFAVLSAMLAAMLALPTIGLAQEASIIGVISDDTGGVMPGVTVTVTHDASGNSVTAVTNERGEYSAPARTGPIHITAELAGFATINRAMELLVGQRAVINLQMTTAALSESVTVTGASPLLDTTQSKIGGNIDRRQMQELPVNGRNFMDLTMLAPGSRSNAVSDTPFTGTSGMGQFQVNVDGQQITQNVQANGSQLRLSKDSIEEFQFISNRFDATQGRSAGVQINVVTKSGTNKAGGTFSGYFRNDKFIAKDFVAKQVLPYSDQQISGTYGGPLVKDKAHYFANVEFEREPGSFLYQNTRFPKFDSILTGSRKETKINTRIDFQISGKTHLMIRGSRWHNELPYDQAFGGAASTVNASQSNKTDRFSDGIAASLTTVVSGRALNVLKLDHSGTYWDSRTILPAWTNANNPNTWPGPISTEWTGGTSGTPNITFTGYQMGSLTNLPQRIGQETIAVRDDYTYVYNAAGRHSLKTGGEYLNYKVWHKWCNVGNGQLQMNGAPPANLESFFPNHLDPGTWNMVGLSSLVRNYRYEIGGCRFESPRNIFGGWVQDDWEISSKLTLNIGGRYDVETGTFANEIGIDPWIPANRPNDKNNYVPRLGAAYKLTDKTVLRGGWGKYYSELINQTAHNLRTVNQQVVIDISNNGRPDFAINPWNGPAPTFDQAVALFCSTQNAPLSRVQTSASLTFQQIQAGGGCLRRAFASSMPNPSSQIPYSYQGTIGFQHQINETMGFDADYVWTGTRGDRITQGNTNLSYNPATGANYPSTDLTHLPWPQFGIVGIDNMSAYSNYQAVQTAFNKRFSHNYQLSATFSISSLKDSNNRAMIGAEEVPDSIVLAQDLAGEYGPAVNDQKYRGTVNGIWLLKYGFQLSGLYFYGSGQRYSTGWGSELRQTGVATSTGGRLRPDGTIIPRNNFVGLPIHRVDMRVLRSFKLGGSLKVDGTFEVFNVFNHENYGAYTLVESNTAQYGQPSQNANVAYAPRTAQLGFRVQF